MFILVSHVSRGGKANILNHGTRTPTCPMGDGSLPREILGNSQSEVVADLCLELAKQGGFFTVENPYDSSLWISVSMRRLTSKVATFTSTFDMCSYGLQLPGATCDEYCRKRTSLLSNVASVRSLDRLCPGVSGVYVHRRAWGHRRVAGRSVSMAEAAGHYPRDFCNALAQVVIRELNVRQ